MTPFIHFLTYGLEVEWLLTWYPKRSNDNPIKIRGGTFRHKTSDDPFEVGNKVNYLLGQGAEGDGDPISPNNIVAAFITVGVSKEGIFQADLQLNVGSASRSKGLILRPDTITPFMINVAARGDNPEIRDTAAVLQGVITAGQRIGLLDLLDRIIGP